MSLWIPWNSIKRRFLTTSRGQPLGAVRDRHKISFSDLPPEMISHIASFLPVCSAAALALCSRTIHSALGTKYWDSLRLCRGPENMWVQWTFTQNLTNNARSDFLSLLEKYLPDHIFCRRCDLLHSPIFEFPQHKILGRWRLCATCESFWVTLTRLPYQIRFPLLEWTMKRHRMNLNCSKELKYFSSDQLYRMDQSGSIKVGKYSVRTARIRNGTFLVRMQDWYLFPANHTINFEPESWTGICPHITFGRNSGFLTRMIDCTLSRRKSRSPCSSCEGLWQCRYCHTEFQLDVKEFGSKGMGIVITAWVDLGECRTPHDPKWQHRNAGYPLRAISGPAQRSVFELGSIRELFEDGATFLFDTIITPSREKELLRLKLV